VTVIGVPKQRKGGPSVDPECYWTVGLESCFLKLLTLLVHKCLYDWAERNCILPPSQNGFHHSYHTNNNAFVLCCLIERARSLKKSLYVAFVDISNAFPSTDHPTLWLAAEATSSWGIWKAV
jgi:hypothetical protein